MMPPFRPAGLLLGLILMLAAGLALLPAGPALAQGTFVCPNGPGPGERQVGMTPGGGNSGVAQVPVCVRDGPAPPPPPPMRAIDSYVAAAWHRDSNDAWIGAGYHSPERARAAAINACNQAMGGGCTVASENVNGAIVISRGSTGILYASSGKNRGSTEKQAHEYCRKQNDECLIVRSAWGNPGSAPVGASVSENGGVYGPEKDYRRRYGAVAGLDPKVIGDANWLSQLWVAGGFESEDAARRAAMAACQRDAGKGCVLVVYFPDVLVAFATGTNGMTYYSTGATIEIAEKRVQVACKKDKMKCRKGGWVNLAYKAEFLHDPSAEGMPWFTAQAWIKGDAEPWRSSVWSVSGGKTGEATDKAALAACKKDSKQECELVNQSFNTRVLFYTDAKQQVRVSWVWRGQDPAAYVARKCAATKDTCRLVKVIDGRSAVAERIEVK